MNFDECEIYSNLPKQDIVTKFVELDKKALEWEKECEEKGKYGRMIFYICWIGDGWHAPPDIVMKQENFKAFHSKFA